MKHTIEQFMSDKHIAVIGVSREKMKWGNILMRTLSKRGFHVYAVNPHADMIEGIRCVPSIDQLPRFVTNAILAISYESAKDFLTTQINQSHLERIWLPTNGSHTDKRFQELYSMLKSKHIDLVYDVCPMMFFVPAHIHKMHYTIRRWSKSLPGDLG